MHRNACNLLKHCSDGNLQGIKKALKNRRGRKRKIELRDNHNWTCLHHAARSGSVECMKYLLSIDGLDTAAESYEGETALHIATNTLNVPLEMLSLLVDANPDLVNYVNNEELDLLQCATLHGRLDIVKLLAERGAPVNKIDLDGDTVLHLAAIEIKLDFIRYLLYGAQCDATVRNYKDYTACFLLFVKLMEKIFAGLTLASDEVECFEELALFTYNQHDLNFPTNASDIKQMIVLGYQYNQQKTPLYASILKLFYVPPSKEYFVQKLLESSVPSCHSLVIALLLVKDDPNTFERNVELSSVFLQELFSLFLAEQSFFDEYIPEIMSSGITLLPNGEWRFSQIRKFCTVIDERGGGLVEQQQLFTFLKALILFDINFETLIAGCDFFMTSDLMPIVIVALAESVRLTFPLGDEKIMFINDFNESEDVLHDLQRLRLLKDQNVASVGEVVSLKNLSRMSVRRFYFKHFSHFNALKALYALDIPVQLRNFLCYNFNNLKF